MTAKTYGPGLGQKSPKLSLNRAFDLLEEQYNLVIPLSRRIAQLESIEIGDYDFNRQAFPVYHHGLSGYTADYWVSYPLANYH